MHRYQQVFVKHFSRNGLFYGWYGMDVIYVILLVTH